MLVRFLSTLNCILGLIQRLAIEGNLCLVSFQEIQAFFSPHNVMLYYATVLQMCTEALTKPLSNNPIQSLVVIVLILT